MVVVVESCGLNSTFVLNGPDAEFVGSGDLHDVSFDYMKVSAPFIVDLASLGGTVDSNACDHILHVFPSDELEDSFHTSTPVVSMIIVVSIFMFAVLVFLVYDFVVTRRQNKVQNRANRTGAIVEQFFPDRIREQLFSSAQPKTKSNDLARSTFHERKKSRRPSASVESIGSFIQESAEGDAVVKKSSKAIADLYPAATIMFAEIPAFTAWSSIREPTHIFMLLEAIFQAFDEIAKKRHVFKVETVADCYVAAW